MSLDDQRFLVGDDGRLCLSITFRPEAHPRDWKGRFRQVVDGLGDGQSVDIPGSGGDGDAITVTRYDEDNGLNVESRFEVMKGDETIAETYRYDDAAEAATDAAEEDPDIPTPSADPFGPGGDHEIEMARAANRILNSLGRSFPKKKKDERDIRLPYSPEDDKDWTVALTKAGYELRADGKPVFVSKDAWEVARESIRRNPSSGLSASMRLAQRPIRGSLVQRKSSGDAVRALQRRLSDLGYEVSTDGVFGEETERAVKEFQESRGAKVDGKVGEETLGKLLRAHKAAPNPANVGIDSLVDVVSPEAKKALDRQNAQGETGRGLGDLRARQRGGGAARSTGGRGRAPETPKGPHGGIIDPATGKERATTTTGPIGSTEVRQPTNATFEEKHPRAAGGQFAKKGDSGEEVRNAQAALNRVGGARLTEDGEFGNLTDQAVRDFQKKKGLKVDGIVGPVTSKALRRRLNAKKKARERRKGAGGGGEFREDGQYGSAVVRG